MRTYDHWQLLDSWTRGRAEKWELRRTAGGSYAAIQIFGGRAIDVVRSIWVDALAERLVETRQALLKAAER